MLLLLLGVLFCMQFQTSNAHSLSFSLCVTLYAYSFTLVLCVDVFPSLSRTRIVSKNLFTLVWLMNVCEAAILLCTHATHIHSLTRSQAFLCCNVSIWCSAQIESEKIKWDTQPIVYVCYKWIGRWQRSRNCGFPSLWEDFLRICSSRSWASCASCATANVAAAAAAVVFVVVAAAACISSRWLFVYFFFFWCTNCMRICYCGL